MNGARKEAVRLHKRNKRYGERQTHEHKTLELAPTYSHYKRGRAIHHQRTQQSFDGSHMIVMQSVGGGVDSSGSVVWFQNSTNLLKL